MSADDFLYLATVVAFVALAVAFATLVWRIVTGPTTVDRILALDMMVAVAVGFIAVFGVRSGFYVFLDVGIALGLVGFLSTVSFARFVLMRSRTTREIDRADELRRSSAEDAPDG